MSHEQQRPLPGCGLTGGDQRREAFGSPRALKEPGSVPWCYQTLELLKIRWEREESTAAELRAILDEIKGYKVWEKIPPECPYGDLDRMLQRELGITERQAEARVAALAEEAEGKTLLYQGRRPKGEQIDKHYNIMFMEDLGLGTGARYLTARIARDRPDILERMKAGEFKSVRAAAREAGLVVPMVNLPLVPVRAARLLSKHFTPEQLDELIALLLEEQAKEERH